jgi:hypothetical protein
MKKTALFLSLALIGIATASAADPAKINWSKIPVVKVPLFFRKRTWARKSSRAAGWNPRP